MHVGRIGGGPLNQRRLPHRESEQVDGVLGANRPLDEVVGRPGTTAR